MVLLTKEHKKHYGNIYIPKIEQKFVFEVDHKLRQFEIKYYTQIHLCNALHLEMNVTNFAHVTYLFLSNL